MPLGAAAYPEGRFLKSGAQLLGYLEGRPGITKITKVEPWKSDGWEPGPRGELPADVVERVEELPQLQEVEEGSPEWESIYDSIEAAYWECEDGGAWVEVEVEYEEASS